MQAIEINNQTHLIDNKVTDNLRNFVWDIYAQSKNSYNLYKDLMGERKLFHVGNVLDVTTEIIGAVQGAPFLLPNKNMKL